MLSLRSMVTTAVFTALLCVVAPVSIPLPGLVPVSLATFAVYIASALLGGKRSALAVVVYILLGAVGVPVFSGYQGGLGVLFGVTGGYIVGYIPLALVSGALSDIFSKKYWTMPVGMIFGTVSLYAFGTVWYMLFTGNTLAVAVTGCILPFIGVDIAKITIAAAISVPLKARLSPIISQP